LRIAYLLLHDFRFASIGLDEFASDRYHFSKEYARRMADLGHEVELYVMFDGIRGSRELELDGYRIKAFGVDARFPPGLNFGNAHSFQALKGLDSFHPDVVHLHNYYLWSFPFAASWVKKGRFPLVAQYHGTDPIRSAKGLLFAPWLNACDRILVPSESERAFLGKVLLTRNRLALYPSTGVDTEEFRPLGGKDSQPLLLYVGRVPLDPDYRWEKSPQLLLPILKSLREAGSRATLLIAGDGPGLAKMKEQASSMGLSASVQFVGQLSHHSLPDLYSRASLTFVPFLLKEITPFWDGALQESLACGTPVVGFSDGAPRFSGLGVLVPTDPTIASQTIVKALDDEPWARSAGEAGPRAIGTTSEWGRLAKDLSSTYAGMAEARH